MSNDKSAEKFLDKVHNFNEIFSLSHDTTYENLVKDFEAIIETYSDMLEYLSTFNEIRLTGEMLLRDCSALMASANNSGLFELQGKTHQYRNRLKDEMTFLYTIRHSLRVWRRSINEARREGSPLGMVA